MASNAAMASEIGKTRYAEAAEAATSTTRADSVAYATEDSGSEAKIGRAKVFGSSVSSSSPLAIGRPTMARLNGRTGPAPGNALLICRARRARRSGGDHHRARRVVKHRPHIPREGMAEASLGLDG